MVCVSNNRVRSLVPLNHSCPDWTGFKTILRIALGSSPGATWQFLHRPVWITKPTAIRTGFEPKWGLSTLHGVVVPK